MAARYRFAPTESRFTVQAFAAGVLSFLGHSPTFAVRDFAGITSFDNGTTRAIRVELTVQADSLELLDQVKESDREEIEGRMRREVLETAAYPQIAFQGAALAVEGGSQGRFRVRLGGQLSLHGVAHSHQLDADLLILGDGVRLRGESVLLMSDYRIKPVTALAGTLKLKDEVKASFDLAGVPEES